jgi:SAM-dependent methyltransferase
MQPAEFYTGIVAELYAPLKSASHDPDEYARFVEEHGQPALELGCGDGDPLIELRRRGLDVEGADSSADMLDRCRRNAAAAGVEATVYQQRMEALDLPRRYRSIFLAGPTFTLLPDDDAALAALRRIRAHLDGGGVALVPLFVPESVGADGIGEYSETTAPDGAVLRCGVVAQERDEAARTQLTTLRYERHAATEDTVVDRPWLIHWYTRDGFAALAEAAGLIATVVDDPDDENAFAFLLR